MIILEYEIITKPQELIPAAILCIIQFKQLAYPIIDKIMLALAVHATLL